MTKPENFRQLIRVLARRELRLGTSADRMAASSEVVAWAQRAFAGSCDSPAVPGIAGLDVPPDDEILDDCIRRLLDEIELGPDQLLKQYELLIAEEIVDGRTTPRDGALDLYRLPADLDRTPGGYGDWPRLCNALDLARAGTYGSVEEIEQEIRAKAKRVLEQQQAILAR
jgi:hypothetical protein